MKDALWGMWQEKAASSFIVFNLFVPRELGLL